MTLLFKSSLVPTVGSVQSLLSFISLVDDHTLVLSSLVAIIHGGKTRTSQLLKLTYDFGALVCPAVVHSSIHGVTLSYHQLLTVTQGWTLHITQSTRARIHRASEKPTIPIFVCMRHETAAHIRRAQLR